MDEKLFMELVAVSSVIAERSRVSILREQSKTIVSEINALKQGVFVVAGLRGTGKTTLLAEIYRQEKQALFVNAEILLRHSTRLLDFSHYALAKGYQTFLIDEIHVLSEWEKDIKILYDETKGKIVLSGSSAIILKAKGSELGRRARTFELKPFSFREYLIFQTKKQFPIIMLKDIINPAIRIELQKQVLPYIHYFGPYCNFDALPAAYFEKNKEVYVNIIERIIRYDLVSLREVDSLYLENIFRIIKAIASSSPGELSYSGLASSLGIGIKLAKQMVSLLQQTGMIYLVPPSGAGKKAVRKEEKILMPLSFRTALCNHNNLPVPAGAVREDFFIQHLPHCRYLKTGIERRTPDFVFGKYIFEVGGPSKSTEQIKRMENAYLVKEAAPLTERELPLYLFGFLY
ncbi:MAG: AAA family ATPase [Nanoarchaeota archaeon]